MSSLPTGTVSFLFTDIEGSTELLQRLGDHRYRDILEQHHALMRAAFEPEGGREVDTQGDAFFVAFPTAPGAVAAAATAQRAFAGHPWPEDVAVRVRMGIHTGEPTLGPGGYVGLDVHRAARICSAGHGGQIVLSERTCALVRETLPGGVQLRDLGEHRLKDLARPEHIFQVVISGLPDAFPPLKSLDALATNLPSLHLTSFIGREREMAEIRRLLSTSHLVTVKGPGGAGKTRLALQVAADLLEQFPRGAWLIELAPLADAALVPQTVAAVFGVREAHGRPLMESLVDALRPRELLLVLDNCEHLVDACAALARSLLRDCPKLRVLATSREALRVPGEVVFPIPSLASPDPEAATSVERLLQFDSARLFVERAVLSNPAFTATDANAPAIARIIQRLDGIPLAIELAAARVKVLSVEQIARRLADRFRLLAAGSRTGLPHHQTLRAAVDWSHDLLADDERALFRRLSVFAGGFTLEAAEAVCADGAVDEADVLDVVARLVDKSLVMTEAGGEDVRYRLLETMREYGRERLEEAAEAEEVRGRHLAWYRTLAEQAEPHLRGPRQVEWLERLEEEHDNFRAALDWARAGGHREPWLHLAGTLHRFWALRGYLREGREWLEGALAGSGSEPVRARAAYGAAVLAFGQGDYARAEALARDGLALYRALGDGLGTALSLNVLASVQRNRADYAQARTLLEESLALARQGGHRWALAEALNILGVMARSQRDYARARALLEEGMDGWRAVGDKWGLASALGSLGVAARLQGDYERAWALHEESLALRRELGDKLALATSLGSLGTVAMDQGDHERAVVLFEESLALSRELGDKLDAAAAIGNLGLVARRQGDADRAEALLTEGLGLWRELDHQQGISGSLIALGLVALMRGDRSQASALLTEGFALAARQGDRQTMAHALVGLARVGVAAERWEAAAMLFGAAEALREAIGVSVTASDSTDYEQAVATLRVHLPGAGFDDAWARGRSMSHDEAVALALGAGAGHTASPGKEGVRAGPNH